MLVKLFLHNRELSFDWFETMEFWVKTEQTKKKQTSKKKKVIVYEFLHIANKYI